MRQFTKATMQICRFILTKVVGFLRLDARVPLSRIEKFAVYCLILLGMSFPIIYGLPESWTRSYRKSYTMGSLSSFFPVLSKLNYHYDQASFYSGMDSRWVMFSGLHRGLFKYTFKAKLGNGEIKMIPIESQDPDRPWYKQYFVDYKVAKFFLNMHSHEIARKRYSLYLCRHYKNHFDQEIKSVLLEHSSHGYVERETALKTGTHYNGPPYVYKVEETTCDEVAS